MIKKILYICSFLMLIAGDILFFQESSDIRIFGIIVVYILCIKFKKFNSTTTFILSLILIIFAYIQFLFSLPVGFETPTNLSPTAERTAVWAFLLIVIGIIQKWKE